MTATLTRPEVHRNGTPLPHTWRDIPTANLKIPASARTHVLERGTVLGHRLDTFGQIWDAIEEGIDVGIVGALQERVIAQIEDARNAESGIPPQPEAVEETTGPRLAADPEEDDDLDEDDDGIEEDHHEHGEPVGQRVACPNCQATGAVEANGESQQCPTCAGTGFLVQVNEPEPVPQPAKPAAAKRFHIQVNIEPDDRLTEIHTACDAFQEAQIAELKAKAAYKTAKSEREEAEINLREAVGNSRQPRIPFDKPEKVNPPAVQAETAIVATAAPVDDESFRDFPLARWTEFDLPAHIVRKLADFEGGITTVGHLADFRKPQANGFIKNLTDIPKIGKGAAEKIENANEKFWEWWGRGGRESFAKEKIDVGSIGDVPPSQQQNESGGSELQGDATDWAEPAPSQRAEG